MPVSRAARCIEPSNFECIVGVYRNDPVSVLDVDFPHECPFARFNYQANGVSHDKSKITRQEFGLFFLRNNTEAANVKIRKRWSFRRSKNASGLNFMGKVFIYDLRMIVSRGTVFFCDNCISRVSSNSSLG